MADRSVQESAAYEALSVGGRRVFHVLSELVGQDGVAISLAHFMERGMCRSTARIGIKQCELLGFVTVSTGPRSVGVFRLSDGWRGLDMVEAKRRVQLAKLPRQSVPPGPVTQVQVVELPRTMRRVPSLAAMPVTE